MRTPRRNPVFALAALALGLAACTEAAQEADPFWDDDLGKHSTGFVPPAGMVTFAPGEATAELLNPERGYYTGYKLEEARDATSIRTAGFTLALAIVNLDAYSGGALPPAFLAKLGDGFAAARQAGIKLIVRFTYDDTGGADAPRDRILGHVAQLAPVLAANVDVISAVQAGLIGRWGEWHGSANGLDNDAARRDIITALLAAVPSSRSVQLRRPKFKDAYSADALRPTEAFTGSARARLGHHNDCFLASNTDLGTYDAPIESWKAYLADETKYVPMGGETCAVYTARTNCAVALEELERFHWSYLNRKYNTNVINEWIEEGCESTIQRKLGYRFVMTQVGHTPTVAPGGVLELAVDVHNRGYAIPMNERPVDVILTRGTERHVARLAYDARTLAAGETTTIRANLRVPAGLAAGTYTLSLRMPDASPRLAADPRYAIQLANTGTWDAATGDNILTDELVIDPTAGGTVDASAATFAQI